MGSLVEDLGIGPEVWVFLSLLGCLTLFFKFSRFWSVRNLDLLLIFVLAPGLMYLVGSGEKPPFAAFILLFVGSACWLIRCFVDLGLTRRPLLEPNLNTAGLTCLAVGILGLLLAETVSLPMNEGAARNPAGKGKRHDPAPPGAEDENGVVKELIKIAPLPSSLRPNSPPEILKRVLASLAHVALVTGLITVGWWHFERPITGVGMATCYLILPYTRVELIDSTQLVPAALVVTAIVFYHRPALAGGLIGLAAWWMPPCLGLLPLWFGFYFGRGGGRFALAGLAVVAVLTAWAWSAPDPALWVRAVGARTLADTGLAFTVEAPRDGSIWSRVDVNFRIPVLIGYLTLILVTSIWPLRKNLAELIALSAAQLIACQFWYLDAGGTLILLYLPLVILMMFRPNLAAKRPNSSEPRARLAR